VFACAKAAALLEGPRGTFREGVVRELSSGRREGNDACGSGENQQLTFGSCGAVCHAPFSISALPLRRDIAHFVLHGVHELDGLLPARCENRTAISPSVSANSKVSFVPIRSREPSMHSPSTRLACTIKAAFVSHTIRTANTPAYQDFPYQDFPLTPPRGERTLSGQPSWSRA